MKIYGTCVIAGVIAAGTTVHIAGSVESKISRVDPLATDLASKEGAYVPFEALDCFSTIVALADAPMPHNKVATP
jgi:hypothetical protein